MHFAFFVIILMYSNLRLTKLQLKFKSDKSCCWCSCRFSQNLTIIRILSEYIYLMYIWKKYTVITVQCACVTMKLLPNWKCVILYKIKLLAYIFYLMVSTIYLHWLCLRNTPVQYWACLYLRVLSHVNFECSL